MRTLAADLDTYDILEHPGARSDAHERFRRHGVAVRNAAERIGEVARLPQRDELAIAALLHDVGQLVLVELYGDEHLGSGRRRGPEERVRRERRELGIDHALVGAVLIRRWGFGGSVATAVERHHAPRRRGPRGGDPARRPDRPSRRRRPGRRRGACARPPARLEIDESGLSALMFEFPHSANAAAARPSPARCRCARSTPCAGSAEGKVYKQIAQELSLSVSTVRTHLHNVYRKIGAVDRAQAVLIAPRAAAGSAAARESSRSGDVAQERPMATAWARSRASRRARTALVWVRTVSVLRPSRLATVSGRVPVGE